MTFREALALLVADVEPPRDDRELQRLVCRIGDAIAEPSIERMRALWGGAGARSPRARAARRVDAVGDRVAR